MGDNSWNLIPEIPAWLADSSEIFLTAHVSSKPWWGALHGLSVNLQLDCLVIETVGSSCIHFPYSGVTYAYPVLDFVWVLGAQTLVLTFVQQSKNLWRYLSSFKTYVLFWIQVDLPGSASETLGTEGMCHHTLHSLRDDSLIQSKYLNSNLLDPMHVGALPPPYLPVLCADSWENKKALHNSISYLSCCCDKNTLTEGKKGFILVYSLKIHPIMERHSW